MKLRVIERCALDATKARTQVWNFKAYDEALSFCLQMQLFLKCDSALFPTTFRLHTDQTQKHFFLLTSGLQNLP